MNTTTDTAAPFTPTHVYNVPSLSISYEIERSNDKGARIRDTSGFVSEWLPVVQVQDNGATTYVIDPNGYAIPVSHMQQTPFTCSVCNETKQVEVGSFTTGYARDGDTGAKICFACMGEVDADHLRHMEPGDRYTLYLCNDNNERDKVLSNWPGTFKIPVSFYSLRFSRHNFGCTRVDFRFQFEGNRFSAYNIGDTDICHIRRIKN